MTRGVRFLKNGSVVEVGDFAPAATVLDYLREVRRETGTKEGCAEGDCGACSVAVGELAGGSVRYRAVNSCIQFLGTLDGKELVTVEDLSPSQGALHPVQEALVRTHGSQCGFCTPGFVMALFTLYHRGAGAELSRESVNDAIAGNLCRCTGYRPIVEAGLEACRDKAADGFAERAAETAEKLKSIAPGESLIVGNEDSFFAAPASEDELAALYLAHPDATLVAGATDVGLWITKQLKALPKLIYVGRVRELIGLSDTPDWLQIGAAVSYTDARPALGAIDPDIDEVLRRLGSDQVRNAGTVGGNIANGSPIGDSPPVLIALGAEIELRRGDERRTLPLEDFFIDYGLQDRAPGEFLARVTVPKLADDQVFRCFKISKRFDQDITASLGAFRLTLDGRTIAQARIAFGGMAATPKRAAHAERALAGASLDDPAGWETAVSALEQDYTPLSDMRASAQYRMQVAQGLLRKALIEVAGAASTDTRVEGMREAVNG